MSTPHFPSMPSSRSRHRYGWRSYPLLLLLACLLVVILWQASFRELWRPLLALAEGWSRSKEAPLSNAAARLYVDLFVVFESALEHQQVLQALHSHLGSGVMTEQDVALQVRHLRPKGN